MQGGEHSTKTTMPKKQYLLHVFPIRNFRMWLKQRVEMQAFMCSMLSIVA